MHMATILKLRTSCWVTLCPQQVTIRKRKQRTEEDSDDDRQRHTQTHEVCLTCIVFQRVLSLGP